MKHLLLLCCLAACSSSTIKVNGPPDTQLDRAMATWNRVAGCTVFKRGMGGVTASWEQGCCDDDMDACMCVNTKDVYYPDGWGHTDSTRYWIWVHELGHVIGLDHNTYPGTAMYPTKITDGPASILLREQISIQRRFCW